MLYNNATWTWLRHLWRHYYDVIVYWEILFIIEIFTTKKRFILKIEKFW